MGKGKGKASGASPKGGTRKIARVHIQTPRAAKPSKPSAGSSAGGGSGSKKSSARKHRPSEPARAAATSSTSAGFQSAEEASSASAELFKVTCTCPHLAHHPDRGDLQRKLVNLRLEVCGRVHREFLRCERSVVDDSLFCESTIPLLLNSHRQTPRVCSNWCPCQWQC